MIRACICNGLTIEKMQTQSILTVLYNTVQSFKNILGINRTAVYVWSFKEYKNLHKKLLSKQAGTYGIYNPYSKKLYIGSSINLSARLQNHLVENWHSNKHLQSALKKYGKDNFQIIIFDIIKDPSIIELEDLVKKALSLEDDLLDIIFPTGILYNISSKASSRAGIKHSEESKLLISKSNKGRIVTELTRLRIRNSTLNRKFSEETKLRMKIAAQNLDPKKRQEHLLKIKAICGKPVALLNLITKEYYEFRSCTEAANFLGLKNGGDISKVAARDNNVYKKLWQITYINNDTTSA